MLNLFLLINNLLYRSVDVKNMDSINNLPNEYVKNLYKALLSFLVVLILFFAVKSVSEWRSIGMMVNNTVTLSGHGEVNAVPDIANVYFTIRKEGKTVKEAQNAVAVIEKSSLDFLKNNSVAEKDIKTTNSSFNPKYEYRYDTKTLMPCNEFGCPPRPGKNVISGYEAYENITVKVRNTDDVGKIMQGLGELGVSELSGPNFTIDNEDDLKALARKKAIDDAKEKAKILARDLGVRLGKVVNFSEGGEYGGPMYFAESAMMKNNMGGDTISAEIPKGENTISSDVTIVYEIR